MYIKNKGTIYQGTGLPGTVSLLSQDCGKRFIPAQQLREHSGAHVSGHDGAGQLVRGSTGTRPGEAVLGIASYSN